MMPRWEIVDLDAGAEDVAAARTVLAPDELARAARFLREEDRRRFAMARSALRRTLAREMGADPRAIAFRYGPNGKPSLEGNELRFNLSHAGGRALIAWTDGGEIGVDIENVRPVRFGEKIARRYFSDDERRAFGGISDARWNETFFRCWTRKEAFIKAIGDGLSYPLRSFDVPMGVRVADGSIRADGARRWRLDSIDAGPGFVAAIVTEREGSRGSS
ncbi:MAG TPA: 4'-phosphopantetheinyl transferase superfamily protein [Candidatus Polarisedimenticolaceae bacterium]|nr:4'-phosphopantetheinyl transferase superfamily protein [Candidatus Polarisedimenticolaceae bacterium]